LSAVIHQEVINSIPHLRAFARLLTGNRERADDLVQDAIVRALTAAEQFTPGTNFKAWIFTILRNLYFNELRRNRVQMESLERMDWENVSTPPTQEAGLELDDFKRALMKVSLEQREALILVSASGFSYEEAARVCDCAIGTIKSRVSRARSELSKMLAEGGADLKRTLESRTAPRPDELGKQPAAAEPSR
jgi:RNA polymerase sigma-70 factor (ECF subfamily)